MEAIRSFLIIVTKSRASYSRNSRRNLCAGHLCIEDSVTPEPNDGRIDIAQSSSNCNRISTSGGDVNQANARRMGLRHSAGEICKVKRGRYVVGAQYQRWSARSTAEGVRHMLQLRHHRSV